MVVVVITSSVEKFTFGQSSAGVCWSGHPRPFAQGDDTAALHRGKSFALETPRTREESP